MPVPSFSFTFPSYYTLHITKIKKTADLTMLPVVYTVLFLCPPNRSTDGRSVCSAGQDDLPALLQGVRLQLRPGDPYALPHQGEALQVRGVRQGVHH
jgi:hypothetical protein